MPGYEFGGTTQRETGDAEEVIRSSVFNYCHETLGWSQDECEERIQWKLDRRLPKFFLDQMARQRNWQLDGSMFLDVGCGQGGVVLESLERGADAYGIEPSQDYVQTAQMRVREDGHAPDRISVGRGESLPFPSSSFDYVSNLYVLEHVENSEPILEEIYRVLRPGGELHLRCENYLAFREQHYRVPWIPLLPKTLGSIYLKAIGRDPSFLNNYVFYTTYPQVVRTASEVGFENATHQQTLEKVESLSGIESSSSRMISRFVEPIPPSLRRKAASAVLYFRDLFAVGTELHLVKPEF